MGDDFRGAYSDTAIPFSQGIETVRIRIEHPRFLVRGRVETSEYNWASLTIEFSPARQVAEWVTLTDFLRSFANRSMPLEQAAREVITYIKTELRPASARVTLRTCGADGFVYEVVAE
jgi:NADPH-dependent 7-cyano-7-deazaguanine reductase QueF